MTPSNTSTIDLLYTSQMTHYTRQIREARAIYHNKTYSTVRFLFILEGHCGPDE